MFLDGVEGARVGKFSHANSFFCIYSVPAANNFFPRPGFLQTPFFFTCIQFLSVFTASANNLFQKIFQPRTPPTVKKSNSPSLIVSRTKNAPVEV